MSPTTRPSRVDDGHPRRRRGSCATQSATSVGCARASSPASVRASRVSDSRSSRARCRRSSGRAWPRPAPAPPPRRPRRRRAGVAGCALTPRHLSDVTRCAAAQSRHTKLSHSGPRDRYYAARHGGAHVRTAPAPRDQLLRLLRATRGDDGGRRRRSSSRWRRRAPTSSAKAKRIKEIEHECDTITHHCVEALHKTFITPIERDDIYRLIAQDGRHHGLRRGGGRAHRALQADA